MSPPAIVRPLNKNRCGRSSLSEEENGPIRPKRCHQSAIDAIDQRPSSHTNVVARKGDEKARWSLFHRKWPRESGVAEEIIRLDWRYEDAAMPEMFEGRYCGGLWGLEVIGREVWVRRCEFVMVVLC